MKRDDPSEPVSSRPRLFLVHGPTPIVRRDALDAIVGAKVFVKRDDATGGAESGNKLRKLEWLLADAIVKGNRAVITCGGIQSNHARATALTCAALGLRAILLLRVSDPAKARRSALDLSGNVLLDTLAGAEIRFVSPDEYGERTTIMEQARVELAERGEQAYVVPEGGSNGLGALGYIEAMRETRQQMDMGLSGHGDFDVIAHACGSGGTATGVALGAARFGVAKTAWAFCVSDDRGTFEKKIAGIALDAHDIDPSLPVLSFVDPHEPASVEAADAACLVVDDGAKGPSYGIMSDEQKVFLVRVARETGIVLDPVYTGKALFGLARAVERGDITRGARVLFIHTGGLPGLLAQGEELRAALDRYASQVEPS
jgi:D-cysteine desulfhydrase